MAGLGHGRPTATRSTCTRWRSPPGSACWRRRSTCFRSRSSMAATSPTPCSAAARPLVTLVMVGVGDRPDVRLDELDRLDGADGRDARRRSARSHPPTLDDDVPLDAGAPARWRVVALIDVRRCASRRRRSSRSTHRWRLPSAIGRAAPGARASSADRRRPRSAAPSDGLARQRASCSASRIAARLRALQEELRAVLAAQLASAAPAPGRASRTPPAAPRATRRRDRARRRIASSNVAAAHDDVDHRDVRRIAHRAADTRAPCRRTRRSPAAARS